MNKKDFNRATCNLLTRSKANKLSAILNASFESFPSLIPNTHVQALTPKDLATQSSLPISSQGNLNDSSIFFRSYRFSPSGNQAEVLIGEIILN